jgi:arsenate reductase-like glutaredoxin family protein
LTIEQLEKLIGDRDHIPFLNPKNELYRERNMKEHPPSRDEAIRLIAANPNLLKRPLAVKGRKILFGFDAAEWAGLK